VRRNNDVARITDAPRSRGEELRYRERRYVLMMSIRAVCLILIVVLFEAHVPYMAVWIPVLIAGVVALPWLAVVMANDRSRRADFRVMRRPVEPVQAALAAPRAPDEHDEPHVIDVDLGSD
jgi:Flp pilus assembly protein TadB